MLSQKYIKYIKIYLKKKYIYICIYNIIERSNITVKNENIS